MRQEVRVLKDRAVGGLMLAIELFNRPSDRGRQEAVLIHADHAFELLLKAIIVHKAGASDDAARSTPSASTPASRSA